MAGYVAEAAGGRLEQSALRSIVHASPAHLRGGAHDLTHTPSVHQEGVHGITALRGYRGSHRINQ